MEIIFKLKRAAEAVLRRRLIAVVSKQKAPFPFGNVVRVIRALHEHYILVLYRIKVAFPYAEKNSFFILKFRLQYPVSVESEQHFPFLKKEFLDREI